MRLVEAREARPILIPVMIGSDLYGESVGVARRIGESGMLVQCNDMVPLGAIVTVHFRIGDTDDELVARATVRNHLTFEVRGNVEFAARGMRLDFLDFDENLPLSLPGTRVLH